MKKLITLLLILSVICAFVFYTPVFAEGTGVVVSTPSCKPGDEVAVEISMPVNTGVVSVQLVLSFDAELTLTNVVDGGILGVYNHSDNYTSPYVLSWENDKITENITATGKLVTLKFKVSSDAQPKNYPVTITHSELLDKDINDVQYSLTNGYVTVTSKSNNTPVTGGGGGGGGAKPTKPDEIEKSEETTQPEQPIQPENIIKPSIIYKDVSSDDWFYEYVTELSEKGIVSGIGNGAFAPNDNVTREQFLKMILMAAEIDTDEAENKFDDVDDNAWYKEYVLSAKKLGIVNGISETQFGIGANITRQDMAVIISRMMGEFGMQTNVEKTELFADYTKVSNYAKNAVTFMKTIGLIQGYNNEFRPLDNLTRAEAAKVIAEFTRLIQIH